ncbi:cytochrome P450 family protein [Polyangium aurulentum]|uniref:cytochrome P450 family protein n=1 Tax=Polyangium aurulentum TaxID=2567896 RepID=UPI0010ADCB77|nr:cytochrome P450 [Polyangium aurulentum]UQA59013.1 cytochrome P450 [Polyangium aurulentum]
MPPIAPVDLTAPEFKADPFPFYARLRREAPVHPTKLPDKRTAHLVTRYDDVVTVLKDDARFVKDPQRALTPDQMTKQPWFPSFLQPLTRNMLDIDDPDHRRLRNLVHKAFTPRIIEDMRGRVQRIVDELLTAALIRGKMDLVRDFALPLPLTVIVQLLGVPPRDQGAFHRWSRAMMHATSTARMLTALPDLFLMMRYLRKLIRDKRERPQSDLLTALVQAEQEGGKMSEDELIAMIVLLMLAGHETTVNLIASGTLALLQNPTELERLRQDPSLIDSAVEELLRYTAPVETATERYTSDDVQLAGVTLPRGSLVLAVLASANRDASQFEDPDRLNLSRTPNRHVAFGQGIHFCLGAPLARLEGQLAFPALLRRLPRIRLAASPQSLRWRPTLVVRGLESLPVTL